MAAESLIAASSNLSPALRLADEELAVRVEREGFAIQPSVLARAEVQALIALVEENAQPSQGRGGVRDVMEAISELQAVAKHPNVRAIVESVLGREAFVVRTTLFDKTPDSNWKVPWHQDLTIAVKERHDAAGYGPWSVKQSIQHVQPPTEVLARMLTVRIHLDPCPASNGALRVLAGTHRLGRLNQNLIEQHIDEALAVTCEAQEGDALVMRPLLLHASSPSSEPGHRRVLHFDFGIGNLASGLAWRMQA